MRALRRNMPEIFLMSDEGVAEAIGVDVPEDVLVTAEEAKGGLPCVGN